MISNKSQIEGFILNDKEVNALCRILEREWIPHDDDEAYNVVSRLFKHKDELDRLASRTNQ